MKTGRLLEVDMHPNFRTLMEHKGFLSTWCRTSSHTTENNVFFLNTLKVSLAPDLEEVPFCVLSVRNQHCDERDELNTCELDGHDATKITPASADSRENFSWMTMSFWVRTLCLCSVLMTIFLSSPPFSISLETMSSPLPSSVHCVSDWYQKPFLEHYYCQEEKTRRFRI